MCFKYIVLIVYVIPFIIMTCTLYNLLNLLFNSLVTRPILNNNCV